MMGRWLGILFLISVLAVAGCGPQAAVPPPEEEVILTYAVQNDAETMSPNTHGQRGGGYVVFANLYSALMTLDWGITVGTTHYGDLAETWDVDPTGQLYTFNLYQNAVWHDGEPVTSADVKYTYERMIDRNYPFSTFLADVKEISTPDDHTVVIELTEPNVAFLPMMAQAANWYGKIMPKHVWGDGEWDEGPGMENPIGSGPFKFAEWEKGSYVVLEAFDDYFRGRADVDKVIVRTMPEATIVQSEFRAGNIEWLPNQFSPAFGEIDEYRADPDVEVVETGSHYNYDVWINVAHEPLNDPRVRHAIAYAINADEINQLAFSNVWIPCRYAGLPLSQFTNKNVEFPAFDPDRAEELFEEAGLPRGAGGWRFDLELIEPGFSTTTAMAEILVEQFKAVGINARWIPTDHTIYGEYLDQKNYQMTIYYTRYGPDPDAYREHFATGGPRVSNNYSNPQLDELAAAARVTTDLDERIRLYGEIQEIIVQDAPIVSIFNEVKVTLVETGWTGFAEQESGFNQSLGWSCVYNVKPPNR